ncbi:DeoR/GlpR family DNA-binding transcription regulator [Deinococcus maricopensis]|uniref:Transcriptional regulator, DeoR family n=1 Tax=Deinococcus maricopensis (strain DSM 21211 / LMG 22137 / NRRL B-23946 / LB-34) TaxID=709986 RepID=E8U929_DEIML|nr:DeoR/GlpR family DNA-binding transcription regulator [Deinococcus maricopensis]ADV67568.1 transcriptional regulator, DeoR family [Deinococcus maricopensis DSM 21211]
MTQPLAEERHAQILSLLMQRGSCRTTEIVDRLGISGSTVRRDLDLLAERGLIRKVHGGAIINSQDQVYQERQTLGQREKERIGQLALTLLAPGQILYLDAGTTALQVALALKRTPALTRTLRVVTHGINVAYELNGECQLMVIGGENYGSTYSLVGPDALSIIERYSYDVFLVGCTSIDPARGLTNSNLIEAQQKTAIMARARQSVLIADHSKWNVPGFATFAALSDVRTWVTDAAPPDARTHFERAGVRVLDERPAQPPQP